MNAHAKRWVTALTVGPLVIVLVLFGSEFYFAIFMALLIVGAMIEYALMSFGQSARFELGAGIITGLLVIVPAVAGANLYFAAAISGAFILSFLFCSIAEVATWTLPIWAKRSLALLEFRSCCLI